MKEQTKIGKKSLFYLKKVSISSFFYKKRDIFRNFANEKCDSVEKNCNL